MCFHLGRRAEDETDVASKWTLTALHRGGCCYWPSCRVRPRVRGWRCGAACGPSARPRSSMAPGCCRILRRTPSSSSSCAEASSGRAGPRLSSASRSRRRTCTRRSRSVSVPTEAGSTTSSPNAAGSFSTRSPERLERGSTRSPRWRRASRICRSSRAGWRRSRPGTSSPTSARTGRRSCSGAAGAPWRASPRRSTRPRECRSSRTA
jgi:hypothetical protein